MELEEESPDPPKVDDLNKIALSQKATKTRTSSIEPDLRLAFRRLILTRTAQRQATKTEDDTSKPIDPNRGFTGYRYRAEPSDLILKGILGIEITEMERANYIKLPERNFSRIPRFVRGKSKRTKISPLAKRFEEPSQEFEKERKRQRDLSRPTKISSASDDEDDAVFQGPHYRGETSSSSSPSPPPL